MAKTPETSAYTSIRERIREHLGLFHCAKELLSMDGDTAISTGLPYQLTDYLELVDWTGRAIRADKSNAISTSFPPILQRLGLQPHSWMAQQNHFGKRYYLVAK